MCIPLLILFFWAVLLPHSFLVICCCFHFLCGASLIFILFKSYEWDTRQGMKRIGKKKKIYKIKIYKYSCASSSLNGLATKINPICLSRLMEISRWFDCIWGGWVIMPRWPRTLFFHPKECAWPIWNRSLPLETQRSHIPVKLDQVFQRS